MLIKRKERTEKEGKLLKKVTAEYGCSGAGCCCSQQKRFTIPAGASVFMNTFMNISGIVKKSAGTSSMRLKKKKGFLRSYGNST